MCGSHDTCARMQLCRLDPYCASSGTNADHTFGNVEMITRSNSQYRQRRRSYILLHNFKRFSTIQPVAASVDHGHLMQPAIMRDFSSIDMKQKYSRAHMMQVNNIIVVDVWLIL